jgi:arylsulfatase A-like enzyme
MASMQDVRRMFDGYDVSVRYADDHVGRVLDELDALGIADETAVLVSSDHGETLGELGIYCDHQTADLHTHRVPVVLKWPGLAPATDHALHYQVDVAATVVDLLGVDVPESWDGRSFRTALSGHEANEANERDHLVLSCAAWATQRSVRFDRWLCVRTYHDAFHSFPTVMLFDVVADPHEQVDLADERPDVVDHASRLLIDWETKHAHRSTLGVDPLWTVLAEGGGYYTRGHLPGYLRRLAETGRTRWVDTIRERLGDDTTSPPLHGGN